MDTKSFEEMARGIAEFHLERDCACDTESKCHTCNLTGLIQEALITTYNTAIEDAEKVAEKVGIVEALPNGEYERGFDDCAKDVAKEINKLRRTE